MTAPGARRLRYASLFSGIEAASVAWGPLGWVAACYAEIEPFCRAVLAHRFPAVPNLGDVTKLKGDDLGAIDLLVGGSPCQSFSVAGKRAGLDDPRGNLTLEFLRLVGERRPRWVVWENVPGVLSIDDGLTFGTVLGTLGKCGYGFAYRVLDAQYFGVPQRRRRVFVVGYLGDWRPAAAVLLERTSLSGNPAPSREARQGVAGSLGGGSGSRGWAPDTDRMTFVPEAAMTLNAGGTRRQDGESETFVTATLVKDGDAHSGFRDEHGLLVAHALRADGFDAGEDGTGRGTPLVVRTAQTSSNGWGVNEGGQAYTLDGANGQAVAFDSVARPQRSGRMIADSSGDHGNAAMQGMSVRRLLPVECEKLQGFPPGYTDVPYRGKAAADGPRYRALGNSMATPVVRWLGERIDAVESVLTSVAPGARPKEEA